MAKIIQSEVKNQLLSILSVSDFSKIATYLEFCKLLNKFSLSKSNIYIEYAYFIESGIGSIVAISPKGHLTEVGIFGRDGMTPAAFALDTFSTPHDIFMQVSGDGYRIETSILVEILNTSPTFQKLMLHYAQTLAIQTAFTALSNSTHNINERLARWILMCHDRTEGDEIALTHEFLSIMLSVRRPSVTAALHFLEGKHFIFSERGLITVRNRKLLEKFANDAYGFPEKEYQRLIHQVQ